MGELLMPGIFQDWHGLTFQDAIGDVVSAGALIYLDAAEKLSQIVLVAIAAGAAFVAKRQLGASATLELFNILEDEKAKAARSHVIRELAHKPFPDWDKADLAAAQKVGAIYSIVGALIKSNYASRRMFVEMYCSSIQRTYKILFPYRMDIYEKTNRDKNYWAGYEWLYQEAKNLHDLYPEDNHSPSATSAHVLAELHSEMR